MTLSGWDAILASALTVPGVEDPDGPLTNDAPAFVWGRWNTPTWSAEQAFARLGIVRVEFPEKYSTLYAGFATRAGIGLNSRTRRKVRTAAHELAHVVLRHTNGTNDVARVPIEEFEADCVALLCCHALDLGEIERADCRFYIQRFVAMPCAGPMPLSWDRIKDAARAILDAGAGRFVVVAGPKVLQVERTAATFAARIQWHS